LSGRPAQVIDGFLGFRQAASRGHGVSREEHEVGEGETIQIPQQIRKKAASRSCHDCKYTQCLRGDFDFQGIFLVGPPAHSRKMKINGINRTFTFPTQIQLLTTYDTVGV